MSSGEPPPGFRFVASVAAFVPQRGDTRILLFECTRCFALVQDSSCARHDETQHNNSPFVFDSGSPSTHSEDNEPPASYWRAGDVGAYYGTAGEYS